MSNGKIVGDASGSDMELPQQAVNALIQRTTESSSESESHAPPNPSTLYANSLLKQFVAQTQMLNAPCATLPGNDVNVSNQNSETNNSCNQKVVNGANSKDNVKRKRGRPKKANLHSTRKESNVAPKATTSGVYCINPNVSPDSGIQNSPDHTSSPEPCPSPNSKTKDSKKSVQPDRTKVSKETRHNLIDRCTSNGLTNKMKEQSKLPVTSNRFDRLLYANADRVLYPPRRKVGRPPINRKGPGRPPKHKVEQSKVNEKTSKENEHDKLNVTSYNNNKVSVEKNNGKLNKTKKHVSSRDREASHLTGTANLDTSSTRVNGIKDATTKKTKSKLLYEICERVSKRLEMNNRSTQQKEMNNGVKQDKNDNKSAKNKTKRNKTVLDNKLKLHNIKAQYTTLKNAKLMHSKHKHKKHKKCKFKILKPLSASVADPKVNIDIEKLIADFVKYCYISSSKPSKENIPEILKALKKVSKKRKTSEYNERKKKKQTVSSVLNKETNNSNEQRLPLKKRHYHLSAGNENKPDTPDLDNCKDGLSDAKIESKTKSVVHRNITPTSTKVPVRNLSPATGIASKTDSLKLSPAGTAKYIPVIKALNTTPPKTTNNNNNEYENVSTKSESVGCHIDEAIEACITRFSGEQGKTTKPSDVAAKDEKITTTTPKKRHRFEQCATNTENIVKEELPSPIPVNDKEIESPKIKTKTSLESVVNELKMKKTLTGKTAESGQKKLEKKSDAVAQIMTRKKNRLEDLTSTLVSKIATPVTENVEVQKKRKDASKAEETSRDSVIKYPVCKKVKPSDTEKLDFIDAKPTGIFMPSTDLEVLIPVNTIELKTETSEETKVVKKSDELSLDKVKVAETTSKPRNLEVSRKRIRKRRAINRTGFPTIKRKKKKPSFTENSIAELSNKIDECDRVPKPGEEYSKFLQRTEKCYTTTEIMQKSHSETSLPTSSDIENAKWEGLSECDSLPQEERTEIEQDDIREKMSLRSRDLSPATSIDTISDRSRVISDSLDQDLDELPLEVRIRRMEMKAKTESARKKREMLLKKRKHRENLLLKKRKLRDVSPASSIENMIEKRLREESASASSDEFKRNRKIPRWRKRYLVAGLFSDYYKEDK